MPVPTPRIERGGSTREVTYVSNHARRLERVPITLGPASVHIHRNAMNGVLGYAKLLLSGMAGPLVGEQARFIERIVHAAERCNQLIDEAEKAAQPIQPERPEERLEEIP
jgi:signal transduction histidine kinase